MKVIIKRPNKASTVKNIDNTLEALQGIVGGYIETVTYASDYVALICNEEGRLLNLPFNCRIRGVDFCGPVVVAGVDGDEFTDVPMSASTFERFWLG